MKEIDPNHVDVTQTAEEVGLGFDILSAPVAVTKTVWNTCIEWTDCDTEQQDYQEQDARLWDVLFTCGGTLQLKFAEFCKAGRHDYSIFCIPRDGKSTESVTFQLTASPQLFNNGTTWLVIDFAKVEL